MYLRLGLSRHLTVDKLKPPVREPGIYIKITARVARRVAPGDPFCANVIGSRPGLPAAAAGSETVESFGVYIPYALGVGTGIDADSVGAGG